MTSGRPLLPANAFNASRVWSASIKLLIAATLLFQLLNFIHISQKYPFYFMWDMDEFAATESFGFNSGLIPKAIFHPGFGMHLLHHFVHIPAYWLGIVSAYDMHDVQTSLNPLLVVAELTAFLRWIPPILGFAIVVCLWWSIAIHFRLSPGWSLVTLLAIATPQSLLYQSAMIRFEIYAIFYWSVALLLIALAARNPTPITHWGLVVIAGLLLGLSFLSKVQVLSYLAAFPFVALFFFCTGSAWAEQLPHFSKRSALRISIFTGLGLIVFAGFLVAAARATLPPEILEFDKDLNVGHKQSVPIVGCGVLLVAGLLGSFQALCSRHTERLRAAYAMSAVGSCLFLGFVLSLFCHFMIFSDPRLSLRYLIYDTRMAFVFPGLMKGRGIDYYLAYLSGNLTYNWVLYSILTIAVIGLLAAAALKWIPAPRMTVAFLSFAYLVTLLNLVFFVRFILRDLIWAEMLAVFLAVVVIIFISNHCSSRRTLVRILSLAALGALSISNLFSSLLMADRLDAAYNVYGWQPTPWFGSWWNNDAYVQAVRFENDSIRSAVFASARRHGEAKKIAEYVFKNVRPDLRGVGVLSEGLSVWRNDSTPKIAKFPARLRGALVFDVQSQQPQKGVFFTKVSEHDEYLQKIAPEPGARSDSQSPTDRWLSVLGRPDLTIYIFLEASDRERLTAGNASIAARDVSIVLNDGQTSRELRGAEILNYSEIPLGKLASPYFFVIAPNVGDRSAWLALWP